MIAKGINKFLLKVEHLIKKKEFYIPFSLLLSFILFRIVLENLVSNILINNVFSHIHRGYEKDIIILLTFIIVGIYYYIKKTKYNFRPSWLTLILLLILSFIYLFFYRFNDSWVFTSFTFYPNLYYTDSILYYTLIYSFLFLIIIKNDNTGTILANSFVEDNPLKSKEGDILGRRNLVEIISRRIENTSPENSFAIGINSIWGAGKPLF